MPGMPGGTSEVVGPDLAVEVHAERDWTAGLIERKRLGRRSREPVIHLAPQLRTEQRVLVVLDVGKELREFLPRAHIGPMRALLFGLLLIGGPMQSRQHVANRAIGRHVIVRPR